jgi:hypothetical protein
MKLKLLASRFADPHSFHSDPDPIRIQGFNDQKLNKITVEKKNYFWIKNYGTTYLSLGLHKEHPSYRRNLQLSKEAIQ